MWHTTTNQDDYVDWGTAEGYGNTILESGTPPQIGALYIHEVTISDDLQPNTLFHSRVRSGSDYSHDNSFRTAMSGAGDFRFLAYGDNSGGSDTNFQQQHFKVANSMLVHAWSEDAKPRFVLHVADFVHDGGTAVQWHPQFFDPAAGLLGSAPLLPTIGNHEYQGDADVGNYTGFFCLETGTPAYPERWYSFYYGVCHFICVNSNKSADEMDAKAEAAQESWLQGQLQDTTKTWKFVFLHHPAFSDGGTSWGTSHDGSAKGGHAYDGEEDMSYALDTLAPLFRQYGVDAIGFSCDLVIDRCTIQNCGTGLFGGHNVVVTRSALLRNRGGIYCAGGAELVRVESTRIEGNETALSADAHVTLTMASCLISGGGSDGAFYLCAAEAVELINCTITACRLVFYWAEEGAPVNMTNCIVWGNESPCDGPSGPCAEVTATYSDIQRGYQGLRNIDAGPRFLDPANGNYRLRTDSPCIDAGTGDGYWPKPVRDAEGKRMPAYGGKYPQRPDFLYYDMGAYEHYVNSLHLEPDLGSAVLTRTSFWRSSYSIFYSADLLAWHLADGNLPSAEVETTSWIDDGSKTGVSPPFAPRRFYRILENPE